MMDGTRPTAAPTGHDVSAAERLHELSVRLGQAGWYARLDVHTVPSGLHIANPVVPALQERVTVRAGADGTLWFWFSWGEPICPAIDLDTVAARITHVLSLDD